MPHSTYGLQNPLTSTRVFLDYLESQRSIKPAADALIFHASAVYLVTVAWYSEIFTFRQVSHPRTALTLFVFLGD